VTELSQAIDRHARNVLINEDFHSSGLGDLERSDLLFGQSRSIVQAS
jgi:hypothetical protein